MCIEYGCLEYLGIVLKHSFGYPPVLPHTQRDVYKRQEYTLVIRQYTSGITRLSNGFGEESMTEQTEMLQFSDRIMKLPLQLTQVEGEWIISTQDGIQRALINRCV